MRPGQIDGTRGSICAVVVTYNPDKAIAGRLRRTAQQVHTLLVIDNGSADHIQEGLDRLCKGVGYVFIPNPANLGMACALNQGAGWACDHGFTWLLTLDQDTIPNPAMVQTLLDAAHAREAFGSVIVGAQGAGRGARLGKQFRDGFMPCAAVITSGTVMRTATFRELGPFREDLFIDHVDTEYCLRARAHSIAVICSTKALMIHTIGCVSVHRFGWWAFGTTNHTAIRRYYCVRNAILVAKLYWRTDLPYTATIVAATLKALVLVLLFESGRQAKLKAMLRGFRDGFRFSLGYARRMSPQPFGLRHRSWIRGAISRRSPE